jgi:hypothetical protein
MAKRDYFLDAAYAIALSSPGDQHHRQALALADEIEQQETQLITTRAVVLEIGNALAKLRYRQAAVALLAALENDPRIEIVPLSEELYQQALHLFQTRLDKEWGLTDCISFEVMKARGITQALTTDHHFAQAGFQIRLSIEQ